MDLKTAVDIAQLAGTATIIGGTVFGLLQLREFRVQRREAVACDLMRGFMSPEFADAMSLIFNLPAGTSAEELHRQGPEIERAATLVCTTLEGIGVLVYERVTPFDLAMKTIGGVVIVLWQKLQPWVEQLRLETGNRGDSEWFQWLAERCAEHSTSRVPAYEQYRDWQP